MILTASRDGTARLWRPEFEPQLGELESDVGRANDVAASPDGRLAASAGEDGVVQVFRARGGLVKTLRTSGRATVVLFTTDGKRLVAAADDGSVMVWRVRDWRAIRTLRQSSPIRFAAVSRDGRRLVTGADDRRHGLWSRSHAASGFHTPGNSYERRSPPLGCGCTRAESTERQFSGRSRRASSCTCCATTTTCRRRSSAPTDRSSRRRARIARLVCGERRPERRFRRWGTIPKSSRRSRSAGIPSASSRPAPTGACPYLACVRRLPARDIPRTCRDRHPGSVQSRRALGRLRGAKRRRALGCRNGPADLLPSRTRRPAHSRGLRKEQPQDLHLGSGRHRPDLPLRRRRGSLPSCGGRRASAWPRSPTFPRAAPRAPHSSGRATRTLSEGSRSPRLLRASTSAAVRTAARPPARCRGRRRPRCRHSACT